MAAALGVAIALTGPAAYTLDTAATAHSGAIPSAGPAVASGTGFGPAGFGAAGGGPAGLRGGPSPGGGVGFPTGSRPLGGGAGFLGASRPGTQLTSMLERGAASYEWVAATIDANSAAGYELAPGDPVMAIGGFNGSDPAPSLAHFEQLAAAGRIHYFIASGAGGGAGGLNSTSIAAWVSRDYTATTVDGVTVYDLARPASSS